MCSLASLRSQGCPQGCPPANGKIAGFAISEVWLHFQLCSVHTTLPWASHWLLKNKRGVQEPALLPASGDRRNRRVHVHTLHAWHTRDAVYILNYLTATQIVSLYCAGF